MTDAMRRSQAVRILRSLRGRTDVRARLRRLRMVQHATWLVAPRVLSVLVADKLATDADVAIAERLLAAHRAAVREVSRPPDREDIWTIIESGQTTFTAILQRGDPRELAAYLCNVSRHDASQGLEQGDLGYRQIVADASHRRFVALLIKDALVSLAEGVGALAVENPEQGALEANIRRDPAQLVEGVSARLGIDITPPDVDGGLLKIDTGRGLFGGRDVNALYTAHLLRETVRDGQSRICEIGGGSGRVAYWSRRLGIGPYTIVDLPQVNVMQGWYALKSLPPDEVELYGEHSSNGAAGLRIVPAHATRELRGPFDLVLNQDSFPEMSAPTVTEYLDWIRDCCDGSLMSINHESKPPYGDGLAHVSVPELMSAVGGFELTYRFAYWLRRGYVVELYRVAR